MFKNTVSWLNMFLADCYIRLVQLKRMAVEYFELVSFAALVSRKYKISPWSNKALFEAIQTEQDYLAKRTRPTLVKRSSK